jgi:soluble lytic murein transglycosylase-like protein
MRVGWNARYVFHCLACKEWIGRSSKLLILTVLLAVLVFAFPTPSALVFSVDGLQGPVRRSVVRAPVLAVIDPAVHSIETFLKGYGVNQSHRNRVAESIVSSAKKHNLDPRLIASIVIVESRANPFAISSREAIGIMQVHLPTWGHTADREGVNLFKIEDNVDFGTRILRDYIRQSGLWEGVKRYKGWFTNNPESENSVLEYLAKVQRIYGLQESVASAISLF